MFDINSIKRLFTYDYRDVFEKISPKDNKETMDKKTYEDIFSGAILKIAGSVLSIIASIIVAFILSGLADELFGGVNLFGVSDDMSFINAIPLSLPIAILIYVVAMKDKEQSSLLPFIVLLITAVQTLSSVFSLITWLAAMLVNPFAAILGLVSVALTIVGNLFVITGCLDFCTKTKKAYVDAHTTVKKDPGIKTSTINVEDVSLHTNTNSFCANCGNKLDKQDKFCKNCGHKREQ